MDPKLSRRGFFRLLGGTIAAPVIEPIARKFFFAPQGGWQTTTSGIVVPRNQFLTVQMVTAEALRILQRQLSNSNLQLHREYDEAFATGGSIRKAAKIHRPLRFANA